MKLRLKVLLSAMLLVSVFTGCGMLPGKEAKPTATIYFLKASTDYLSGDCILIESLGHYGLIDAGHRYQPTITDEDGSVYPCSYEEKLSCQTPGVYGEDIGAYLMGTLGIRHLDFVLGTHAHSDHIGGIPGIASACVWDEGNKQSLVDENTVYFYKDYHHINAHEDDLGEDAEPENSWHNQAFAAAAAAAMKEKGALLAELSRGTAPGEPPGEGAFKPLIAALESQTALENPVYVQGDAEDLFDDCLCFDWGAVHLRLYNLFSHNNVQSENTNSILLTLDDGQSRAAFLGDICVDGHAEQKLAAAIVRDVGTIDLVKAAHHGGRKSNSRELFDLFQPSLCVVSSRRENVRGLVEAGALTCARVYAEREYGTRFYEASDCGKALAATFDRGGIHLSAVSGADAPVYSDAEACRYLGAPADGWSWWQSEYSDEQRAENGVWMFFRNGEMQTGWQEDRGSRYYFGDDGFMLSGWQEIDGARYYFYPDGQEHRLGEMAVGRQEIDGRWYSFGDDGALIGAPD